MYNIYYDIIFLLIGGYCTSVVPRSLTCEYIIPNNPTCDVYCSSDRVLSPMDWLCISHYCLNNEEVRIFLPPNPFTLFIRFHVMLRRNVSIATDHVLDSVQVVPHCVQLLITVIH